MRVVTGNSIAVAALGVLLLGCSATHAAALDWSAVARATPQAQAANDEGLLAPAQDLLQTDRSRLTTELELRGRTGAVSGIATWQRSLVEGSEASDEVVLNELEFSGMWRSWYFTVGKKIMSWDVGYAFRPLDVIQQEDRRRLITTTLEGVPLLAAESFSADSAWSIVIANPHEGRRSIGRDEPALVVRRYWRVQTADLYVLARYGSKTGWRGGIAAAHVVNEALEVHGSLLWAEHLAKISGVDLRAGVPSDYDVSMGASGAQALLGVSWTAANKISVLAEVWRDERAWSNHDQRRWRALLQSLHAAPLPQSFRNGLIAIQAQALGTPSLQRDNVLLRLSRTGESWTPSADVLYMPNDRGTIATARLSWEGDRSSVELGWRAAFGPADSLARELPWRRIAYLSATLSFSN